MSLSFTGGLVYSSDNGLLLTADYYRVAVADAIALTQSLDQSHGLRPGARFQGRPVDAVAFWTNAIDTRTQGLDLGRQLAVARDGLGRRGSVGQPAPKQHGDHRQPEPELHRCHAADPDRGGAARTPDRRERRHPFRSWLRGQVQREPHRRSVTTPFIFEENITIDAAAIADLKSP